MGKTITMTSYVDENLMHDVLTGWSVTGILHILNKTPIDCYSKTQPTMETATYGSEFIASRLAAEQIMAMMIYLRYLGVKLSGATYRFGDNKSVVDSDSIRKISMWFRCNFITCGGCIIPRCSQGTSTIRRIPGGDIYTIMLQSYQRGTRSSVMMCSIHMFHWKVIWLRHFYK